MYASNYKSTERNDLAQSFFKDGILAEYFGKPFQHFGLCKLNTYFSLKLG